MEASTRESYQGSDLRTSNPFSTRFIAPGKIPYIFDKDSNESLQKVLDSFQDHRFIGQIVGPHGSGKTALTYDIEGKLRHRFNSVRRLTVRSRRSIKVATDGRTAVSSEKNQLLIIDGFERLSWLHRQLLLRHCTSPSSKRNGSGLLLTTHKAVRSVPVLFQTKSSFALFARIVQRYLGDRNIKRGEELEVNAIRKSFERHQPNLREGLMSLYDQYEHGMVFPRDGSYFSPDQ